EMEHAWGIRTPAHSTWRSDAVTLLAQLGRTDEALPLATDDVARARRFGDPRPLGMALRAAARAAARREGVRGPAPGIRMAGAGAGPRGGEDRSGPLGVGLGDSLDLLRESVAVLRESPARLEFALSLHDLGAALRRKGERVAAREPL